jgi:pyruvate kinase
MMYQNRRAEIVARVGPACASEDMLEKFVLTATSAFPFAQPERRATSG